MVGDTILIKDISINGNNNVTGGLNTATADKLSETLTNNTINALGIDASSRTVWINGQPYGNAYVNIKEDNTVEAPIGAEIFNDFEHNTASGAYSHAEGSETSAAGAYSHAEGSETSAAGAYSHAEGKGTITTSEAEHASGKYNKSNAGTIFSVGIGTTDTDRKNAVEVIQNGDAYMIGIGGYDGKNTDNATKLQDAVSNSVNIIWSDLKDARDNGELVPGKQYRITNYKCTTKQEGTKAENHTFDIIVTADSANTLNEEARAALHEEDTYFSNSNFTCDLNAWKIWYCLDNDTTRFTWADNSENGRGVIYRMIDEFGNDCPYDFKNIQFYRKYDSNLSLWSDISSDTDNTARLCYTFSSVGEASTPSFTDMSLVASNNIYSNVIKGYMEGGKQTLNNNCFFGGGCYSNTLGADCKENTFGQGCRSNIFENKCYSNILGIDCRSNIFEHDCRYNVFRTGCHSNSVGSNFQNNSFGNNCHSNTFGNSCQQNKFDTGCYSNILGNSCRSNKFGSTCYSNTFGNRCQYNIFGNDCQYNTFENGCSYIKFTENSISESPKYSFYQNNHFENGCQFIIFTGKYTASPNLQVQNYKFAQGLQGTSNKYLTIDGERNRAYETYISKDTNDKVKESIVSEKLDKMIEISYDKLYNLRDGAELIPGQQYRIIDYTCTTSQPGTRSAGKLFDIIVTADSISTLNEEARAVQRDGNGDFDDAKLDAWKIWYCLDNDTARFAWASNGDSVTVSDSNGNQITCTYAGTTIIGGITYYLWKDDGSVLGGDYAATTNRNPEVGDDVHEVSEDKTGIALNNFGSIINTPISGKGVIYRMIDEFGNDCPYDFKNIQFYRKLGKDNQTWSGISSDNTGIPCYTFSSIGNGSNPEFTDMSLAASNRVYSNVINKYVFGNTQKLNNICFFGDKCYRNTFGNNCYENTFSTSCTYNTFGNHCYSNTFGNDCYSNTFGNDCYYNSFGHHCKYNSFGEGCNTNTLEDGCYSNSFGNECYKNIIKSKYDDAVDDLSAHHNSFGNGCYNNELGINSSNNINCSHNSFGNVCVSNTLGDECLSNSFGNVCVFNTLGYSCLSNSFGNGCVSNTLGAECLSNSFGNGCASNTLGYSCTYNSFGNDCINNKFGATMKESQFGNAVQYFSVTNKQITGVPSYGDLSEGTEMLVVDNGVRYVNVYTTHGINDIFCINVRICKGLNGTANGARVSFKVDNVDNGNNYKESQLIVCHTSSGTVSRNIKDILSI